MVQSHSHLRQPALSLTTVLLFIYVSRDYLSSLMFLFQTLFCGFFQTFLTALFWILIMLMRARIINTYRPWGRNLVHTDEL